MKNEEKLTELSFWAVIVDTDHRVALSAEAIEMLNWLGQQDYKELFKRVSFFLEPRRGGEGE